MPVAVVTDSTASLSSSTAGRHGVLVVPLQVIVGGRAFDEGREIDSAAVASALWARVAVSTSRPNPQQFLEAYTKAAADGADGIVSLHISAAMSGTYESAVLAARESPVPTEVVDSRSMGMGLGFSVVDAARRAASGADLAAVAAAAHRRSRTTRAFFYVATLEHLRRGGRIGAASALVGSALAIKPLLVLDDGVITPLEKVRTASRALARIEELTVAAAGTGEVELAVQHLDAGERAEELAGRLRRRVPQAREVVVAEVGAVVGAHVGPGLIAVVVAPVEEGAPRAADGAAGNGS